MFSFNRTLPLSSGLFQKAIAKMHIQKILMDARFGQGTCVRIMQEEELAAQAEAGGPSSARDGPQPLDM